jgi:anti-sigma factor RsiW
MIEQEYRISLGAYVLGALEPDETSDIATHLRTCAECQLEYLELAETLGALGSVSPEVAEAGLTGQPARIRPAADLVVQLPKARTARPQRWRALAAVAVAAAVAGAAVGIASLIGQPGDTATVRALRPSTGLPAAGLPAPRTVRGSSAATGVTAVITLRAQPGGTRLDAQVTGVLVIGWECQLVAVPTIGGPETAGSMRVTRPSDGIRLDGPVALPIEGISRVEIRRADGQVLVSLPL